MEPIKLGYDDSVMFFRQEQGKLLLTPTQTIVVGRKGTRGGREIDLFFDGANYQPFFCKGIRIVDRNYLKLTLTRRNPILAYIIKDGEPVFEDSDSLAIGIQKSQCDVILRGRGYEFVRYQVLGEGEDDDRQNKELRRVFREKLKRIGLENGLR